MKPQEFFSRFKEGPLLPLYYFYGEEEYLKDRVVQILLERLGEKISRGLNFEVFSENTTSVASIIDSARTIPFLGTRKIVLVKEAEKISGSAQDQLLSYLENPSKKTTLILFSNKINFRKKENKHLLKSINRYHKYGLIEELNHPYQTEIPDWIKYLTKQLRKTIEPEAIKVLQDLVGNQLQNISNELEKLALFIGERKEISRIDVEEVISALRIESVFDLIDYIGNRKLVEALIALSQLLKSGEHPLKILALIYRQFRLIMKARSLLNQGMGPEAIRNYLKMEDFVWKKFFPQVNKLSVEKLEESFQRLCEADLALKTRGIPQKLVLEKLIMGLCE